MGKHGQFSNIQFSCRAIVQGITTFQDTKAQLATANTNIITQYTIKMKITCCGS